MYFPEFINSLPDLLRNYPDLEVVIAGDDRMAYGGVAPSEGSFGKWAKALLKDWCEEERVRFVGHLPLNQYARLLKSSHIHCYLTRPFVVSWSLLEAMASGCCLVASNTDPVKEVADPEATFWTDHRNPASLSKVLGDAVTITPKERKERGIAQRARVETRWNQSESLIRWVGLLEI